MSLDKFVEIVSTEKKILYELASLNEKSKMNPNPTERKMIEAQMRELESKLRGENNEAKKMLKTLEETAPLKKLKIGKPIEAVPEVKKNSPIKINSKINVDLEELELGTIKRLKNRGAKVVVKKVKAPSSYINFSNRIFSKISQDLLKENIFQNLKRDLTKANMQFLPVSYISVILFSTLLSFFFSIGIFVVLLFYNLGGTAPFFTAYAGEVLPRVIRTFWVMLAIPLLTFIFMYFYPSLERRSLEGKINNELPFAVINMSAISGSMLDPTKIFEIMVSTHEYPSLEKEFIKILNEVNIYGFDLVSALRNSSSNSPSKNLSEIFNGLATTISSGGDLPTFFDKRAKSLLFDYRLSREKHARAAEMFMDIYISVVIAAPMIFMLLLIMMKVSGLGISLETNIITLMMVLGVSAINMIFLVVLNLKQPRD